MTAPTRGAGETPREESEVLFLVQEEVRRLVFEGYLVDTEALARKHGVEAAEVERCLVAVQAMGACAGNPGSPATSGGRPHPSESDLAPPPLPEDYEILGELGRGGMAVVYRARQKALDRVVAVKVLRPGEMLFDTMLRRFEKEAQTLAKLRHPHIVAIHEVGHAGANVFFSMDLVEGASLHDLIARGDMTPTRTVKLMRQVASAISYAHSRGLIHRDLKPANILVDREDHAFVADFGLAREISGTEGMTHTGQILGTPAFMAPEQARGDPAAIGEPADIYALGAILYECLTGRLPFEGKPLPDLIQAVLHEDPPPPRRLNPRVPRDLEVVCLKAMEKDPARRYATAQAFLEDLERFEEGREIRARPPSVTYRMTKLAARHRGSLVTSLVAAAIAGAVLWTVVRPLIGVTPSTLLASADEALAAGRTDAALFLYERGIETSGAPGGEGASPVATRIRIGLASCLLRVAAREEAAGRTDAAAEACTKAGSTLSPLDEKEVGHLREECDERGALIEARRGNLPALMERLRRPTWSSRVSDLHREGILDRAAPALADPADPGHRAAVAALTAALALEDPRRIALWLGDRGEAGARLLPEITAALAVLGPADGANAAAGLEEAVAGLALFHAAAMEGPLAAVAADVKVPASRRLLAARLLAVCADIPWWPEPDGSGTTQGPGDIARLWSSAAALPIDEALRARVDLAFAASGSASALRDRWLAARLGPAVAAGGGAGAWWREHRREDPRDRLLEACGAGRAATPGEVLARLAAAPEDARPLLHSALLLLRPEGTTAPAWTLSPRRPEWSPSSPFLESAWHVALRGHIPEPALQVRIAQFISVDDDPDLRILWSAIIPLRVGDRIPFERAMPFPAPEAPPGIRLEFPVLDYKGPDWMQFWGWPFGGFSATLRADRRGGDAVLRWSRCQFAKRASSFGTDEAREGNLLFRRSQGLREGRRSFETWVMARLEPAGPAVDAGSPEAWRDLLAAEIAGLADAAGRAGAAGSTIPDDDVARVLYAAECAALLPPRGAAPDLARLDRSLSGEGPQDRSLPGTPKPADSMDPSNMFAARRWALRPAARAAIFWARLRAGDASAIAGEESSKDPWSVYGWTFRSPDTVATALFAAGGDPAVRVFVAERLSRTYRLYVTPGMADRLRSAYRADPVPGAGWMERLPGGGRTGLVAWILAGGLLALFAGALFLSVRPSLPLEARLRPMALALSFLMLLPFLRIEIDGTPLPVPIPAILAAMVLSWVMGAGLPGTSRRMRFLVPSLFALPLLSLLEPPTWYSSPFEVETLASVQRNVWLILAIPGTLFLIRRLCRRVDADGVLEPIFDPSWGRWAASLARPTRSHEGWLAWTEKRRLKMRRSLLSWDRRNAEVPLMERRETWGDRLVLPLWAFLFLAGGMFEARSFEAKLGSPWLAAEPLFLVVAVGIPVLLLLLTADRRGSPPSLMERIRGILRRRRGA
jgi:tRNA A-37 threonylcarbamoyl transferase component Bud32